MTASQAQNTPLLLPENERHERQPRPRLSRNRPAVVNVDLDVISRREFLAEFKRDYAPGQHVTFLGPTQRGKTTLCFQMLKVVISPEHKCVILASKPRGRDHMMEEAPKRLNLRRIEEWPPDWTPLDRRRNGYVLQPRQTSDDVEENRDNVRKQFRRAIMANYRSKNPVITVADEGYQLQNNLKLKSVYEEPLISGAPVNAMWTLLQRGRFSSYLAYDAPEHILIAYDPDTDNQKRYADIGGVDPRSVANVVSNLKTKRTEGGRTISEFLWIKRAGPEICIIGMD